MMPRLWLACPASQIVQPGGCPRRRFRPVFCRTCCSTDGAGADGAGADGAGADGAGAD
jgi:hypothetical protein